MSGLIKCIIICRNIFKIRQKEYSKRKTTPWEYVYGLVGSWSVNVRGNQMYIIRAIGYFEKIRQEETSRKMLKYYSLAIDVYLCAGRIVQCQCQRKSNLHHQTKNTFKSSANILKYSRWKTTPCPWEYIYGQAGSWSVNVRGNRIHH